jgi:SAM-dependent methyltransferase
MTEKYSIERIRAFWTQQAIEHRESPAASWSDHPVIDMEIREIVKRLSDGDRVLDIGCANGYSTLQFASHKKVNVRGVDYVPEMIEAACGRLSQVQDELLGTVDFAVEDITNLGESAEDYDKVVVIRVIINLGTWNRQMLGLRESARVLKKGGILLLSEATLQGWHRLNSFRAEWGMPPIPVPPFNQYLDQERVVEAVSTELELCEVLNFASTYFVGTRVLKPLLIQALGIDMDVADPGMEWNRWFAQLPPAGDYGTQKLFVFRKK